MLVKPLSLFGADRILDQKLNALDLKPIARSLMHPEFGCGWTTAQTERAIARYLMFLRLIELYPNYSIVPTPEIDRVWHQHILNTVKYAEDCQILFGQFLHHSPDVGRRNEADLPHWNATRSQTQSLFERHFGENIVDFQKAFPSACEPLKGDRSHFFAACETLK